MSIKKSVSQWAACDGTTDDSVATAQAFAAAAHNAFTLVIDCPLFIHIGTDIERTIFIESGTNVEFTSAGKMTIDNIFHPAFVIANSHNITLTDWNLEYDAGIPANPDISGFVESGLAVVAGGYAQPGFAFNDKTLTGWLAANRGIVFEQRTMVSPWAGPTNTSAVFYLIGDTSDVTVTGMHMYVPANAGGSKFIPMAFSMTPGFASNQKVGFNTPATAAYLSVPHALTFANIVLDGIYFGWQGNLQNATFNNIHSLRYGDLQDANGKNVGGLNKWFAPPHLFYLNYIAAGDPALFNKQIYITDVVDAGPRVGAARDTAGQKESGYALSLKLGCLQCQVSGYTSNRPDGFMDVLPSSDLTVTNVSATYDSSFINNIYPGWRFPTVGYSNLTFQNVALTDTANVTVVAPLSNAGQASNVGIVFQNVVIGMNQWAGSTPLPLPNMVGQNNRVSLVFTISDTATRIVAQENGSLWAVIMGTTKTLAADASTMISWKSEEATHCSMSGGLQGAIPIAGTKLVTVSTTPSANFTLNCANSGGSASASLPLTVQ